MSPFWTSFLKKFTVKGGNTLWCDNIRYEMKSELEHHYDLTNTNGRVQSRHGGRGGGGGGRWVGNENDKEDGPVDTVGDVKEATE